MKAFQAERGLISGMIAGMVSLGSFSFVSTGLGLITTIVIAHSFPADAFGTFVLLQVVVSFLSQISSLGLDWSIAKFVVATDDKERKRELVNSAILLRLVAILVASLVAWSGRALLVQLFSASMLSDAIMFVPLLFLLESTRSLLRSILQGFFRFSHCGITDLLTSSLNLVFVLTVVSFLKTGVVGLIFARVMAVAVACVFAYIKIPMVKKLVFRLDVIRELAMFGLPLQFNDILNFFWTRIDTLVIGALLGPSDIAIYEVARKIPDSLVRLFQPFRSVYFTYSSRLFALDDRNKAARLLNDSARLIAFGATFGAALALVYGKDIIQLIFSAKYVASGPIFALLMVNLCLSLVVNVLGTSLIAVGEQDKPAVVSVINTVGSVLACVILTPVWGITGAAIGTTFGTATVYPAMMVFLRRKLDAKVIPYLKPMAIFCVWGALVLFIGPDSFLAKSISIVLFLLSCVLLSVVTKNDLMFLLEGAGIVSCGPIRKVFPRGGKSGKYRA